MPILKADWAYYKTLKMFHEELTVLNSYKITLISEGSVF
jgi:hypothetical protein